MKDKQLEFEFAFGSSSVSIKGEYYYREGAQNLIQKLVPNDLLEAQGFGLPSQRARFADLLPIISWSEITKAPCLLSVLLLCKYRFNACNFFYDMISRWLLPQKKTNVELFFASDIRLPNLSEEMLSVAEIVVHLKSVQDVEIVRKNLQTIETEIRLGIISNYHARRILEFKGLSSDGKTAMIQERIGSLIQSHSKDFDRAIFSHMQHFLVSRRPEFKNIRNYHHISRIISNLYSLRKVLKQNIVSSGTKRYVNIKFLKTQLEASENRPEQSVLGVLVGLNFFHSEERFEMEHLMHVIQKHLPTVSLVADSPFSDKEDSIFTFYAEIHKNDNSDFLMEEIQLLRSVLPDQIKSNIECLAHPIFMPRNEEDVLRNIMALSRQLRFVSDVPQVTISFEEQKGEELNFTVIIARVLLEDSSSISDLFLKKTPVTVQFFPDRIRRVGYIRRKYPKEVALLRALISSKIFLREDRSVDLYKAREQVLKALCKQVGKVRDFNGGMIYKQSELLNSLKASLGRLSMSQSLMIENFFYAITPIEMRTSLETELLKQFYLLLLLSKKTDLMQKKQDGVKGMVVTPIYNEVMEKKLNANLLGIKIPSHQLVSFQLNDGDRKFAGVLVFNEDKSIQSKYLSLFDCYSRLDCTL